MSRRNKYDKNKTLRDKSQCRPPLFVTFGRALGTKGGETSRLRRPCTIAA